MKNGLSGYLDSFKGNIWTYYEIRPILRSLSDNMPGPQSQTSKPQLGRSTGPPIPKRGLTIATFLAPLDPLHILPAFVGTVAHI